MDIPYTNLPLVQLEKVDTYNPLLVNSGLHEVLAATGMRRGGQLTRVGAKRKSAVNPTICTSRGGEGGGGGGGGVIGSRSLGPKKTRVARGGFVYGGGSLA